MSVERESPTLRKNGGKGNQTHNKILFFRKGDREYRVHRWERGFLPDVTVALCHFKKGAVSSQERNYPQQAVDGHTSGQSEKITASHCW